MKILLNHAVQERRVVLAPGTELERDDAEAQSLIARGVARAAVVEPPAGEAQAPDAGKEEAPPADDVVRVALTDAERDAYVKMNKTEALAFVAGIPAEHAGTLDALLVIEQAQRKRPDVLAAIGAKLFPPVQD